MDSASTKISYVKVFKDDMQLLQQKQKKNLQANSKILKIPMEVLMLKEYFRPFTFIFINFVSL